MSLVVFNDGTKATTPKWITPLSPAHWGRARNPGRAYIFHTEQPTLGRTAHAHYRELLYKLGYPPGTIATVEQLNLIYYTCAYNGYTWHDYGNTLRYYALGPVMPPPYAWYRVGAVEVPVRYLVDKQGGRVADISPALTGLKGIARLKLTATRNGVLQVFQADPRRLKTFPYERVPYEDLAALVGLDITTERARWPSTAYPRPPHVKDAYE